MQQMLTVSAEKSTKEVLCMIELIVLKMIHKGFFWYAHVYKWDIKLRDKQRYLKIWH